jgi:hypothetical protein
LSLKTAGALAAAGLFALHAAHVEVVCWMAARFDLLAFLFTAATLIALRRYVATRRPVWLFGMAGSCILALLSKEAAFCIPLLALCLIPFDRPSSRVTLKLAGILALICGLVFTYRLWFLGGIGGYRSSAGNPAILNFSFIRTAKALLFRQWAVLSWPVNWSIEPNAFLKIGFVLMIVAGMLVMLYCRPKLAVFGASIAFILAAAIPVQHLLLIGTDLAGSRVLYLPTLGAALLCGVLIESCARRQIAVIIGCCLAFFEVAALEHNLAIWKQVAQLSKQTCSEFAVEARGEQVVRVRNLPRERNGVFFLRNGFAACVEMNGGDPATRIIVDDAPPSSGVGQIFTWSEAATRIVDESDSGKRK